MEELTEEKLAEWLEEAREIPDSHSPIGVEDKLRGNDERLIRYLTHDTTLGGSLISTFLTFTSRLYFVRFMVVLFLSHFLLVKDLPEVYPYIKDSEF